MSPRASRECTTQSCCQRWASEGERSADLDRERRGQRNPTHSKNSTFTGRWSGLTKRRRNSLSSTEAACSMSESPRRRLCTWVHRIRKFGSCKQWGGHLSASTLPRTICSTFFSMLYFLSLCDAHILSCLSLDSSEKEPRAPHCMWSVVGRFLSWVPTAQCFSNTREKKSTTKQNNT